MKKIAAFVLFLFGISVCLQAQDVIYTTQADGDWESISWDPAVPAATIGGSDVDSVLIHHVVTTTQNLFITGNGYLVVGNDGNSDADSLIIEIGGGLSGSVLGSINVEADGVLYIDGNYMDLAGQISVSGVLLVSGDLTTAASTITVAEGGRIGVGGNFNHFGGSLDNQGVVYVGGSYNEADTSSSTGNPPIAGVGYAEALPIRLKFFEVHATAQGVKVHWQTASETNNAEFALERSTDGENFETIYTLPGAGNSEVMLNYSYRDQDELESGIYYYRLKQTDYDGQYTYSALVSVQLRVQPNLQQEEHVWMYQHALHVQLREQAECVRICLYDVQGRLRCTEEFRQVSAVQMQVANRLQQGLQFGVLEVDGKRQHFKVLMP